MSLLKEATYQCTACNELRTLSFEMDKHVEKTSQSANGLAMYSDVHRCVGGFLGINNLRVDHNLHIRSFEYLKLPEYRRPSESILGLPVAKATKEGDIKSIVITSLGREPELKLGIHDHGLRVVIYIGTIEPKKEVAISRVTSDIGSIEIDYYASELPFNSMLEQWLTVIVNLMEVLPPTRLGLCIETLRYVHEMSKKPPNPFNVKVLKTILASHEIYFYTEGQMEVNTEIQKRIAAKYGTETGNFVIEILQFLAENPMTPLQEYCKAHNKDLVYLIHLFLILEQEGIIIIDRPGILEH